MASQPLPLARNQRAVELAQGLLQAARNAISVGKHEAAEFILAEALLHDAHSSAIYVAFSTTCASLFKHNTSLEYALCAVELDPFNGEASRALRATISCSSLISCRAVAVWDMVVAQQQRLGKWDDALESINKRVALDPHNELAKTRQGELARRQTRTAAAARRALSEGARDQVASGGAENTIRTNKEGAVSTADPGPAHHAMQVSHCVVTQLARRSLSLKCGS